MLNPWKERFDHFKPKELTKQCTKKLVWLSCDLIKSHFLKLFKIWCYHGTALKILWSLFLHSWDAKRMAKTEFPRGITTNNAHSHSYPRIIVYTWNRAWRFYLRQDFLIMPSLVRSTPVLARAWKLTALLSARRIARLYFADLYQLRKSSFSLVVKPHAVNVARRPTTRGSEPFSPGCGHNTSGLRAVHRFIASRGTK